jgi:L-lysine 2,3-aminomutase
LLDPVSGAGHFEVDESSARLLMQEIQKRLPGYLVPKLVREDPETAYKTIIAF